MSEPSVAIVIAAYNAAGTLPAALAACRAQDVPAEIVVVDDGSTDATAEVAGSAGVTVIRQANRGPAAARNAGWKSVSAGIVLFTDADCVPESDWVRVHLEALESDWAATAGTYGISNPESALARLVHEEIRWRHSRMSGDVNFAGSFNFGVRREALKSVDGFDESFTAPSAEDNDLSYRLRSAGHRIRFVPQAIVKHTHPARLGRYLREQFRHGMWRVRLYRQHPEWMRGDDYAGPLDFVAPTLAVLSVIGLGVWLMFSAGAWIVAGSVAALAVTQGMLAVRIARHAGTRGVVLRAALGFLRAYARGFGMVWGLWFGSGRK